MRTGTEFKDNVLLLASALLFCAVGVGSFLVAKSYGLHPAVIFFVWNSVFLIPLLSSDFRQHFKKSFFVLFFGIWMCVHGLVGTMLMLWVSIFYWIPIIALELFIGYALANWIFRIRPTRPEN